MVKVVVAVVGASDQSQQRPANRVTEGGGGGARPHSPQKLPPFAHLPALAETVTQAQTTPWGARISATINCLLLSAQPSLPPPARTLIFAQLEISGRWRGGGRLNHSRVLTTPSWGLGPFRLHRNKSRRPSEGQGGGRRF